MRELKSQFARAVTGPCREGEQGVSGTWWVAFKNIRRNTRGVVGGGGTGLTIDNLGRGMG